MSRAAVAEPAHALYRRARRLLRRLRPVRSAWYLAVSLVEAARDRWRRPLAFEAEFERSPDPWGYAGERERARHALAAELLDRIRGDSLFSEALEIGCAEGTFTELLASRCESLLAVDYVPLAVWRARARVGEGCVRFEVLDLRSGRLPGRYDLVVVMDVLSSFVRPRALIAAADKLVEGVEPGGYLLLGDVRQSEVFETTWWGRRLLRGGKAITAMFEGRAELSRVVTTTTETHVLTVFRKSGGPREPAGRR